MVTRRLERRYFCVDRVGNQRRRLDLQSHDRARLGSAGASVTDLARLSGGDECRRRVPTDAPAQVSNGTLELGMGNELTRFTLWQRPDGVLSLIIRLRNHVCAQAQEQVEKRGPEFRGLGKRKEKRGRAARGSYANLAARATDAAPVSRCRCAHFL